MDQAEEEKKVNGEMVSLALLVQDNECISKERPSNPGVPEGDL